METSSNSEISWVWAPVVKEDCQKYWPGDGYVDAIGMPLYSFPSFDQDYFGYIRNFTTVIDEKYTLISQFGKPIIIVEFGVTGSSDFQSFWLNDAFHNFIHYPKLKGIVFFYSVDTPGAWGEKLPTPDWRIHPELITGLISWLQGGE